MIQERNIGGWCGCLVLITIPIAYVIVDDDFLGHAISSSWLYSLLFLVCLPILVFHLVKWTVNGLWALTNRKR